MAWPTKAERRAARRPAAVGALILCVALGGSAASLAQAAPAGEGRLDSTVAFLQGAQNMDGGFGSDVGQPSNADFTSWAALALAAAGINPQDQARPGGASAYGYLAEHASELTYTTDFERALLVVDAAVSSPSEFGGVDLVRRILQREVAGEAAFAHQEGQQASMNDTIFAILALSPIPSAQQVVQAAARWVESEQNSDGSWPATCPKTVAGCSVGGVDPQGNVDMTGAALEALGAAGLHDTVAQANALRYLHEAQNPDGGFPEQLGTASRRESTVGSTAWVVQGLCAVGESPELWTYEGSTAQPLGYLASMQEEDGAVKSSASNDENPVFMSAYALPALSLRALPFPFVPPEDHSNDREAPSSDEPSAASSGTAEAGHGGEASQAGGGVIAGGGGGGAALFSRPQPQSRGHTPGGVRLLSGGHADTARARRSKRRDLGVPRATPDPTITSAAGATQAASGSIDRRGGSVRSAGAQAPSASGGPAAGSPSGEAGSPSGAASGGALTAGGQAGAGAAGEHEVTGVLIGTPAGAHESNALEPGAPGLHGAEAGGEGTPWLALGIGALVVLLVLAGTQLERRRPQVIL